jgi:hypothetical protein
MISMRRVAIFLCVFGLITGCAHKPLPYADFDRGDPIVIYEKIGTVVNPHEREEYDVFYRIKGFNSAIFYEIKEGGFLVEIETDEGMYQMINRDPHAREILHDEIQEGILLDKRKPLYRIIPWMSIREHQIIQEKWKILTYDDMGLAITQEEVNRYKDHYQFCLGGMNCIAFGSPVCGLLALTANNISRREGAKDASEGWTIFIGGTVVSFFTGFAIANQFTELKIIEAIKRERRLRKTE